MQLHLLHLNGLFSEIETLNEILIGFNTLTTTQLCSDIKTSNEILKGFYKQTS